MSPEQPNPQPVPSTVLVTGGAGYIGAHAVDRLLRDERQVVVLDNLILGHRAAIDRLQIRHPDRLTFVEGDVGDTTLIDELLARHPIDAVMHFAAFASVGESVAEPLKYYRNNTQASLALIEACHRARIARFVFSSTCATYGEPPAERLPIAEDCPQSPVNPYGWSKLAVEHMLLDATRAASFPFGAAMLRYFNVAGCERAPDVRVSIGEDHTPETHLIPLVLQCALGQRDHVTIFGTDYDTPDGTCIRDYIHVLDLVDAHVAVLDALRPGDARTYNLGIGRGVSVREVIDAAKRVTGVDLPIRVGERRPGDPPVLYADAGKIRRDLGWSARITDLDDIIASAWAWFQTHPHGYATEPGSEPQSQPDHSG
jgi:UDP-glucose 4-epimerase